MFIACVTKGIISEESDIHIYHAHGYVYINIYNMYITLVLSYSEFYQVLHGSMEPQIGSPSSRSHITPRSRLQTVTSKVSVQTRRNQFE